MADQYSQFLAFLNTEKNKPNGFENDDPTSVEIAGKNVELNVTLGPEIEVDGKVLPRPIILSGEGIKGVSPEVVGADGTLMLIMFDQTTQEFVV